MSPRTKSNLTILASFVAAYILASIPTPDWAEPFRPDWVALVLIYWCLALPERVGVGVAWTSGIMLDVLYGSLLGQQAIAKTLIAFIALRLHLRIRMFPMWQQAVFVFFLLVVNQVIVLWVKGVVSEQPEKIAYWTSAIVGGVVWPWVYLVLRDVRRRAGVS